MMREDATTMTVAELVRTHPGAVRLLSDLQIDFFCRSDRTVAEACAEVALPVEEVCSLLEQEREPRP